MDRVYTIDTVRSPRRNRNGGISIDPMLFKIVARDIWPGEAGYVSTPRVCNVAPGILRSILPYSAAKSAFAVGYAGPLEHRLPWPRAWTRLREPLDRTDFETSRRLFASMNLWTFRETVFSSWIQGIILLFFFVVNPFASKYTSIVRDRERENVTFSWKVLRKYR